MSMLRQMTTGVQGKRNLTDFVRSCLSCGIICVNDQQTITSFNGAAGNLTGLNASDLLNTPSARLPPPLPQLLRETSDTGRAIEGREILLEHPKRGRLPVRVTTELIRQPGVAVTAILNELPAPRVLEAQLLQLDRLASLGTLSASMAHEIKNALVPVRTFLELLTEKPNCDELSELAKQEISRIDFIVGQMLRFGGPPKPVFAPIHIHDILQLAVKLTRRHIEQKRLTLRTAFDAASDLAYGDSYQLEAAFMNLLFNSAEATKPKGMLEVSTRLRPAPGSSPAAPPTLLIEFHDTGDGIAPEDMDRLFEPFFTTKSNGTGLGLNITYHIIQEHHGNVDVVSQVGRGTTFTISLPTLPPPAVARQPQGGP